MGVFLHLLVLIAVVLAASGNSQERDVTVSVIANVTQALNPWTPNPLIPSTWTPNLRHIVFDSGHDTHCKETYLSEHRCVGPFASDIPEGEEPINFHDFNGTAESTSYRVPGGYEPILAFGGSRYWHSGSSGTMPQAVWYNFHHPVMVVSYSFESRDANDFELSNDGPIEYEFFGSRSPDCSDSSSWVVLHRDSSRIPFSNYKDFKSGQVDTPEFYTCYGFNVIDVPGRPGRPRWNDYAGNKYAVIRRIKFFGTVESN